MHLWLSLPVLRPVFYLSTIDLLSTPLSYLNWIHYAVQSHQLWTIYSYSSLLSPSSSTAYMQILTRVKCLKNIQTCENISSTSAHSTLHMYDMWSNLQRNWPLRCAAHLHSTETMHFNFTILNYNVINKAVFTVTLVTLFSSSEWIRRSYWPYITERPSRHGQRHTGQGRLLHSKCCSYLNHQWMWINAWFYSFASLKWLSK